MAKLRHYSGTPVAEGIRLEVGKSTVFAVRNENGDISVRMRREPRGFLRVMFRVPFLRGITRLFRDLYRFLDGLSESTELDPRHTVEGNELEAATAKALHVRPQTIAAWSSALLIVIIGFLCLYASPMGAAQLTASFTGLSRFWCNFISCTLRICAFIAMIAACGHLSVYNRLRMYRGAINKAINCYETHREVSVKNMKNVGIIARRSESAFVMLVLCISMIICSCLRPTGILMTAVMRAAVFLSTAAVINEPLLWLESSEPTLGVRIVRAPLTLFQFLTVKEPDRGMMEVAACAFEAAEKAHNEGIGR